MISCYYSVRSVFLCVRDQRANEAERGAKQLFLFRVQDAMAGFGESRTNGSWVFSKVLRLRDFRLTP